MDLEAGESPTHRARIREEVMQESNAVWMWSEAFVQALQRAMLDTPSDPSERLDWPRFCQRLRHWSRHAEEARKEYQQEWPWPLRNLYNFWRDVGLEGIREQAMFARHSCPRFRLWGWRIHPERSNHSGEQTTEICPCCGDL